MSDSIYSPPEADLAPPSDNKTRYYVVSRTKFVLLSVLTMAAYTSYWFYRNWKQIKLANNLSIWPIPRGLFSIFFVHSMFARVDNDLKRREIEHEWRPTLAATLFVLLAVFGAVSGQLVARGVMPAWMYLVGFTLPLFYTVALLPGQKAVNAAAGDIDGRENAKFSAANWIWMALGLLSGILNAVVLWSAYSVLASTSL